MSGAPLVSMTPVVEEFRYAFPSGQSAAISDAIVVIDIGIVPVLL